jgi:DNA-directed RNA polymerase subunit RPC12/RpoP
MVVRFACPACGHKIKTDEALAGRRVKCPTCKYKLVVPNPDLRPCVISGYRLPAIPAEDQPPFPSDPLSRLFATHAAFSAEKQAILEDFLEGVNSCWKLDSGENFLRFAFVDRGELHSFPVLRIGLVSRTEEEQSPPRWRWAWDAPESGAAEDSLRAARQLRELGEIQGIPELALSEFALAASPDRPWFNWHYLAMVACGVCGADFYFKAPLREGLAVVLLGHAPVLAERYPASPDRMAFILAETAARFAEALPEPRLAVVAYLHQRGCKLVSDTPRAMLCADPKDQQFVVRFDDFGRLLMVDGQPACAASATVGHEGDADALPEVSLLPETDVERKKVDPEAEWVAGVCAADTTRPGAEDAVFVLSEEVELEPPESQRVPEAMAVVDAVPVPDDLPIPEGLPVPEAIPIPEALPVED